MVVTCETLAGNGRYMNDNPAATMMSVIITNPARAKDAPELLNNLCRMAFSLNAALPIGPQNRAYAHCDSMNRANKEAVLDSELDLRTTK